MVRKRFRAIDLFSGCGGLTTGLKRAGFAVIGAVENDPGASEAYLRNHAEVHLWREDIRLVTAARVRRGLRIRIGELDLLAGCPPCQGFSAMRTKNGARCVRDDRNDLVFSFAELVEGLLPKTVMLENVPGLANDRRLGEFSSRLERLGYNVTHEVLDAACYGVPQRRRRVILIAGRLGPVHLARPARKRVTVRDAIGGLPRAGRSGDLVHDLPEKRSERIRQLISMIPHDGGSRSDLPAEWQLPCHRRFRGFHDVYGRLAWRKVAPTLTTGCFNPSRGRFLHPNKDRAITMREAALLQTFPKRYSFPIELGKQKIAELIGNALPPEFVRRHARALWEYLAKHEKE